MPILKGQRYPLAKPLANVGAKDTIYVIPHTNEQFVSKEEYDERVALYSEPIWTCQCTGATKLSHQEALESEQKALKQLNSSFPVVFEKPVLELVHMSANPLDSLVDRASKRLYEMLVIGEHVTLKVTSQGTMLRGVVVKVDTSTSDKPNGSVSSSPTSNDNGETNADEARKKFKLLPYKYSVKLDDQDSIINGIPASDLIRETHVPNKDLIKLFIRARAVRSGNYYCSAWVVDENYVRKHSLQKTNNFMSPPKINSSVNSASKTPKEQKQKNESNSAKRSRSEEKPKAKRSLENKLKEKPQSKKRSLSIGKKTNKDVTSGKKAQKRALVSADETHTKDVPCAKQSKKSSDDDDDDDIVLASLKKTMKKKKRKDKSNASDMPLSELQNRKTPSTDSSDEDDIALSELKAKKSLSSGKKLKTNKASKASPSKAKLKQVTLYQLNCVKKIGSSPSKGSPQTTPSKTAGKSPNKTPKSPYQLPPIVARLQKADKEQNKGLYHQLVGRCVRDLTEAQLKALPVDIKNILMPKFERYQEKKKLESMSDAEREAYLLKKKEENKLRLKELTKKKMADARKRFEDTKLDLKPLPTPKLVQTPDGVANELFGDVAMVTEFIACYQGLLMPDDNSRVTSDQLMQALVNGQQGFQFLSKILVVLLQTLLQDQLAEDYKELSCSLSELPVNEYTASELVRLCLRPQDTGEDTDSEKDDDHGSGFEEEVPADVIEQLESSEFHELEPSVKLQILVGFCHRIMASYSVQDYMSEKQQESAELWKKRIAEQKLAKDKKKEVKLKKDGQQKDADGGEAKHAAGPAAGTKEELTKSGSSTASLDEVGDDDDDLVSTLKRRRLMAAKAAEERRKKEIEDKQLREELRQQKEQELMEKSFKDGILLAKHVMRRTSLGLDRNHDRYWFFRSASAGVYVEKGWVSEDSTYCVGSKLSTSSASESETEAVEAEGEDGDVSCTVLDATMPHTGQNLWFVLDSVEDVQKLIDGLHPQGVRESSLKVSLTKCYDDIIKSFSRSNRSSDTQLKMEEDFMIEGTRKELQDMEIRLRHGGLGGVPVFERWDNKLSAAKTVKDFAECLLETQANVVERFVTGMMAKSRKKTKSLKEDDDEEEPDKEHIEAEENDEESSTSNSGVQQWIDAVTQCTTFSRLNVLMGMLESCIKWEKSAENAKCKICRKKGDENRLLLCDECNQAFHLYCLRPALHAVPKGEWFCPACSPQRSSRRNEANERSNKWNRNANSSVNSSDEDEGISEDIEHEPNCAVCGEEGNLAECSTCVSSFHLECHDPPMRHIPRQNTWKCMQCKSGVRLRKSRRQVNQTRKRYTYSDDEDNSEEEVNTKKSKRSSSGHAAQSNKRVSDVEPPVSRTRTRGSDAGIVTPVTRNKVPPKDGSQSADSGTRGSRRSDTSSKENRFFDDDIKQAVLNVLDKLRKHRQSWPFLEPVDPTEVPDYYKIVKKPVDLRTMEDKCISDVYVKPQQFVDDFSLMMKNAEQYNEVESPVYKCISQFEKYFEQLLDRYLPQCTYQR